MKNETLEPDNLEPAAGDPLDRRLAAQLAELPRELEPARDLWPGIAARLAAGPASPQAGPRFEAAAELGRSRRRELWRLAAAALGSAALGAGLTWAALGGGRGPEPLAGASPAAESRPSALAPAAYVETEQGTAADYRLVEADYLRAKEALWVSVYARRDQFSPSTLAAVEQSFAIIDKAIFDLRAALAKDPANRRLEEELFRNHRRGLDLLRRLADST